MYLILGLFFNLFNFFFLFVFYKLNVNCTGEDKYVVFVSGLNVGNSSNPLQFQLLVDHITGHLGDEMVKTFSFCFCF